MIWVWFGRPKVSKGRPESPLVARRRILGKTALLMICLALACPAAAETLSFGGRGEDRLTAAVPVGAGFFAVGTTASADGDLAGRTRSGETGWAIRIGPDGARMWDFCSAKSGMTQMIAPHAYEDGRFALVLTDETRQRGEWIVLNARGRQESRVAIPKALCPEGKPAQIAQMIPAMSGGLPCLALVLAHEDGELCVAALFADGGVRACGALFGDAYGVARAGTEGVVYFGADMGALSVTRFVPGRPPEAQTLALADADTGVARVTDALLLGDGSMLLALQTASADQKSAAVLTRLSAGGDVVFSHTMEDAVTQLAETDTGFAALAGARIVFFDEDGGMQGAAAAPQGLCCLLSASGGAYALTHADERAAKQAVFVPVAPEATAVPEAQHTPAPQETKAPQAGRLSLGAGHIRCEDGGARGVTVSYVDEAGAVRFTTRTPIHTAADRLVWEAAQALPGGEILLTGYYETTTEGGAVREGARAVLGMDGVLREIGTTE